MIYNCLYIILFICTRWLTMSADQIVILILLLALVVKFIFFENREELQDQIRQSTLAITKSSQTAQLLHSNELEMKSNFYETYNEDRAFTIIRGNSVRYFQHVATQTDYDFIYSPKHDELSEEINNFKEKIENNLDKNGIKIIKNIQKNILANNCHHTEDDDSNNVLDHRQSQPRSLEDCLEILKLYETEKDSVNGGLQLTDHEIINVVKSGNSQCPLYKLETAIDDPERGVKLRRMIISERANLKQDCLKSLPYRNFDYRHVIDACCENVLGYVPIPVGYAGPLLLDGVKYFVPMATTEGALVASTNRGCKALSVRGVISYVEDIGMTRAPCVRFANVSRAAEAKCWITDPNNYQRIKAEFDSTSRFGRLKDCHIAMDGPQLYIRFVALTGDAMGMNMVSKGAEMALKCIKRKFPDMQIISLSGNYCCDKKPAAINWIKGRGKRVVTECIIPAQTLRTVLKTEARTLVECNKLKNMSGSAMAGSIGGKYKCIKILYK